MTLMMWHQPSCPELSFVQCSAQNPVIQDLYYFSGQLGCRSEQGQHGSESEQGQHGFRSEQGQHGSRSEQLTFSSSWRFYLLHPMGLVYGLMQVGCMQHG